MQSKYCYINFSQRYNNIEALCRQLDCTKVNAVLRIISANYNLFTPVFGWLTPLWGSDIMTMNSGWGLSHSDSIKQTKPDDT